MVAEKHATPKRMPVLPSVDELKASGDPELAFFRWVQSSTNVKGENSRLFDRDLRKMKLCNYLNGFLGRSTRNHFSWCPHENWDAHWQSLGYPPIPQMK